jgi:hypothetical protein
LKAYYVERNRLFTAVRNLPAPMLAKAFPAAAIRYLWHAYFAFAGKGTTAASADGPLRLFWYVVKAHLAMLVRLPELIRERRAVCCSARLSTAEFRALLRQHSISLKEVAAL